MRQCEQSRQLFPEHLSTCRGTTQESQLLQSRLSSFPTFEEHGTLFITSILAREIGWFERGVKEATHVQLE